MITRALPSRMLIALAALLLATCDSSPTKAPPKDTIGDQLISLEIRVGNIWGGGYSVRVFPEEYLILENQRCSAAKRQIGK